MNLAAIIDGVARHQPERTAIVAEGRRIGYREFNARIACLAGGLRNGLGLARGDRIALFMENNAAFYPLLFAAWRAGLGAVPINAKLHPRELHWIVSNSGCRALFVSPALEATLSDTAVDKGAAAAWPHVIATTDAALDAVAANDPLAVPDGSPADEAWLFYTSGTTGRPKGAVLSHRSLIFMCQAYYADIDFLTADDTTLHAAPLTHGSGLYGLANLIRGGTNVILPGFEPDAVFDAIAEHRNVSMFAAPTMVNRLVNDPSAGTRDLANLRTITYGGAPMYVADLERAMKLFGPRLYQLYGQGESPMTITGLSKAMHADTQAPDYEMRLASIGVARTGVCVRVAREDGSAADPGEIGEIITKSDCLMSGYWNNPEANAQAIRDGWLWTGDLGSMDEAGFLTIRDRSKDMIISGGTNIYPREIEEVLLTHPAVRECAVAGRPHSDWGEEVVAFVVADGGNAGLESELDRLCLASIARFKRPKTYIFLAELPKNNYGKVLKTELRKRL